MLPDQLSAKVAGILFFRHDLRADMICLRKLDSLLFARHRGNHRTVLTDKPKLFAIAVIDNHAAAYILQLLIVQFFNSSARILFSFLILLSFVFLLPAYIV